MTFLAVFLVTLAACFVLRNLLRTYPVAFYLLAITADVAFIAGMNGLLPRELWVMLLVPVQKCYVALALFAIVMLIGVLPRAGKVSGWLRPVRAELSILACLLAAGHMAVYLASYVPRLGRGLVTGSLNSNVVASLGVAFLLLALVVVLGVTSFQFVKHCMKSNTWKRLQRFSYLFFALVYAHLIMMLGPSALLGRPSAVESAVVYTVLFGLYAVLRVAKGLYDWRRERGGALEHVEPAEAGLTEAVDAGAQTV